ncbi:hypothetical protein HERIO_2359 [Hepatospora eriocheir]|uniref:Uncharacterized protein n=1 Tax=Hepatospora eriocheir TaxID=1081669 RepID=A0A1X0Q778_9MICR|nr:hypothetical protein HERIO_2359 [Hepatospora eriocheir]
MFVSIISILSILNLLLIKANPSDDSAVTKEDKEAKNKEEKDKDDKNKDEDKEKTDEEKDYEIHGSGVDGYVCYKDKDCKGPIEQVPCNKNRCLEECEMKCKNKENVYGDDYSDIPCACINQENELPTSYKGRCYD